MISLALQVQRSLFIETYLRVIRNLDSRSIGRLNTTHRLIHNFCLSTRLVPQRGLELRGYMNPDFLRALDEALPSILG